MGLIPGSSIDEGRHVERNKDLPMKKEIFIDENLDDFQKQGEPDDDAENSSKKSLERRNAIEADPAESDSSESENDDDDDISTGKIDPKMLNAISNIYTSVRDDSKRLNEQLERLEELLEGTLGVQLVKKSRTESMSATNSDEEESHSGPESGGVTNTITSLIELPNKQSQTLKQMSTRKKAGHKGPTKQSSLNRLGAIFQSRRLSKAEEPSNSDKDDSSY